MDKSALLNEIVNHPNFKDMITETLLSDDHVIDHLYGNRYFYSGVVRELSNECLQELEKTFKSNFELVKTNFALYFNDANKGELYKLLNHLNNGDSYLFVEHFDYSHLDDIVLPVFSKLFDGYTQSILDMFEFLLDSNFEQSKDANELTSDQVNKWDLEIKDLCMDDFRSWIDFYNDRSNLGFAVLCLNAYFSLNEHYDDFEMLVDPFCFGYFEIVLD